MKLPIFSLACSVPSVQVFQHYSGGFQYEYLKFERGYCLTILRGLFPTAAHLPSSRSVSLCQFHLFLLRFILHLSLMLRTFRIENFIPTKNEPNLHRSYIGDGDRSQDNFHKLWHFENDQAVTQAGSQLCVNCNAYMLRTPSCWRSFLFLPLPLFCHRKLSFLFLLCIVDTYSSNRLPTD